MFASYREIWTRDAIRRKDFEGNLIERLLNGIRTKLYELGPVVFTTSFSAKQKDDEIHVHKMHWRLSRNTIHTGPWPLL